MEQIILKTENIHRSFPSAGGEIPVLRGITLSFPKGKLIIIKGRSGSGKTTLLNILSALDTASSGEVTLTVKKDRPWRRKKETDEERRFFRRSVTPGCPTPTVTACVGTIWDLSSNPWR